MAAPSTGFPLPTGALEQQKSELKALQKLAKEVDRDMAKSAKKGVEISKELVDKRKKIDVAIKAQTAQVQRVSTAMTRQQINARAAASREQSSGGNFGIRQGIHTARRVMHGITAIDRAATVFSKNGPGIDKAEAASELLALGQHLPGEIGAAFAAAHIALEAAMAMYRAAQEEKRFTRSFNESFHGARHTESEDEIARRNADPIHKKYTYVDPNFALNPAHAGNDLGGGLSDSDFKTAHDSEIRANKSVLLGPLSEVAGAAAASSAIAFMMPQYAIQARASVKALFANEIEKQVNAELEASIEKIKTLTARAREEAARGDFIASNKDLGEIKAIDARVVPAINAESLYQDVQNKRLWAQRKSIEDMGVRHIDGRDE